MELDECLRYIIEHGDMDIFVTLVPVDIHSKIACAAPVLGAFVVFFQDAGEVLNMFAAIVFNAIAVNVECEGYWANIVLPEPGVMGLWQQPCLLRRFSRSSCTRMPV